MVIKQNFNFIPYFSILNSVYLSYTYLEAFMLDNEVDSLLTNLGLIISTTFFIITNVFIINIFRKHNTNLNIKQKINSFFFDDFVVKIILINLSIIFFTLIYSALKTNYTSLIVTFVSVIIEAISIALAIKKVKEKAIYKLFGIIAFLNYIAIFCFLSIGFFIEYLGYKELDTSNFRIIFTGIFYHLLNACFLFYNNYSTSQSTK